MITEGVLGFVFNCLTGLLSLLPDVDWSVTGSFFDVFLDFIRILWYVLPMQTCIIPIVFIVCALNAFRIIISLIKTIWDLFPLV